MRTTSGLSLVLSLAAPLLADMPARQPIQFQTPNAVLQDASTGEVRITFRGTMQLGGDLAFFLKLPADVAGLPANAEATTTAAQQGLTASRSLKQSFLVHLPDDGHFGLYLYYGFEPSESVPNGPPIILQDVSPIYVTMADGQVSRHDVSPDQDYVNPPETAPRRAEGASGKSDGSEATQTIAVNISGRVSYSLIRPRLFRHTAAEGRVLEPRPITDMPYLIYGVPGVKVRLSSGIPGTSDKRATTDANGNYSFSFSITAQDAATTYATRIWVRAETSNEATYDLESTFFTESTTVDVSSNTISATEVDLDVDATRGGP